MEPSTNDSISTPAEAPPPNRPSRLSSAIGALISGTDRFIDFFKRWRLFRVWIERIEKRYTRHAVRILTWIKLTLWIWILVSLVQFGRGWYQTQNQFLLTTRGDLHAKLLQTGRVETFTTVSIKSKQSGIITELYAQEGQEVKEDQPLVAIRQLSSLAGNLAQMRADIEKQSHETARIVQSAREQSELFQKGFISKLEYQTAQDKAKAAEIDLNVMRRKLQLTLDEIGLSNKNDSDQIVIRSPLNGMVMRQLKQVGELVNEANSFAQDDLRDAIFTISDIRKMMVTSQINEVDIWKVKKDQLVDIRLDGVPGMTYQGKVISVSPTGEMEKDAPIVTFKTRIEITNPDHRLRPMMTADLDIHYGDATNVVIIPLEAVQFEQDQAFTWIKQGPFASPQRVNLKLGLQTPIEAEVIEGIQANEKVVKKEWKSSSSSKDAGTE